MQISKTMGGGRSDSHLSDLCLLLGASVVVRPLVLDVSGVVAPNFDVGQSDAVVATAVEAGVGGGSVDLVSKGGHY